MLKAININTLEGAEVVNISNGVYTLLSEARGVEPWHAKDFWACWRCEGSADYDRAVRHKRQVEAQESHGAGPACPL